MELKDLIKIIKNNLVLIGAITLVCVLLAYIYSSQRASGYNAAQTYLIDTQEATNSPQISSLGQPPNFDSFYKQEKARNFTDTAVAIIQSADFQNGLISSRDSISVQKIAPQIIKIVTVSQNLNQAQALSGEIPSAFNQKIKNLLPNQPPQLVPLGSTSQTYSTTSQRKFYLLFGAVAGLALGIFVTGLKTYLKL